MISWYHYFLTRNKAYHADLFSFLINPVFSILFYIKKRIFLLCRLFQYDQFRMNLLRIHTIQVVFLSCKWKCVQAWSLKEVFTPLLVLLTAFYCFTSGNIHITLLCKCTEGVDHQFKYLRGGVCMRFSPSVSQLSYTGFWKTPWMDTFKASVPVNE